MPIGSLRELRFTSTGPATGTVQAHMKGREKARLSYDQTPTTPINKDSINVSSLTDITTGELYVNYINAMADLYGPTNLTFWNNYFSWTKTTTVTQAYAETASDNLETLANESYASFHQFGDLA